MRKSIGNNIKIFPLVTKVTNISMMGMQISLIEKHKKQSNSCILYLC